MPDREKVIKALELCTSKIETRTQVPCKACSYHNTKYHGVLGDGCCNMRSLQLDCLALLKAQEQRHRLEVHNIGNIDVPEGVTWEQFQAVMSGVVKALEHTDRGESWPYDEGGGEVG